MSLRTQYDYLSALVLERVLSTLDNAVSLDSLVRSLFNVNRAVILMPGEGLKRTIMDKSLLSDNMISLIFVVDSAVNYIAKYLEDYLKIFREYNTVLITDLDADVGKMSNFVYIVNPMVIVHAHGDNLDKIQTLVPKLAKYCRVIVGTCQVFFYGKYVSYCEGFTDGDRALHLASKVARQVVVLGFDVKSGCTLSEKPLTETKRQKLRIAEKEADMVKLSGVLIEQI